MEIVGLIAQVIVGLGILNVWVLRFNRSTEYRGGTARNMREEFEAYGLPVWFMYAVGALKITLALMLLAGIWIEVLVLPAAMGMAVLMAGAICMHIKVKDAPKKALPATVVLALCILAALL
ncbi:MAG: DoxX family protein [Phycisphaerales bacterium]|nr:DoxX family protein [Phycisphaerales bacterium]